MRLKLIKLWSEPEVFDPIQFRDGVNVILGESSGEGDQARKQNGVGKSLAVDTIRFALLKTKECRLLKVPEEVLPSETRINLALEVTGHAVQLSRTKGRPDRVHVRVDNREGRDVSLKEASDTLEALLCVGHPLAGSVSFGDLRSLLIREESSGYDTITQVLPSKTKASPKIEPHFFLMGIAVEQLSELHKAADELEKQITVRRELKKTLEANGTKLADFPKMLAEQGDEAKRIDEAINLLKADPAFESVEGEIVELETQLKQVRAKRAELSHRIHQIQSIPLPEQLNVKDLNDVYQIISESLAEHVEKSFDQAREFQKKITDYQFRLQREELKELSDEKNVVQQKIDQLSSRHGQIVKQTDQKGALQELKVGLKVANEKSEDYYVQKERYDRHKKADQKISALRIQKDQIILSIKTLVADSKRTLDSLNEKIVEFHKFVQQSAQAALEVIYAGPTSKRPVRLSMTVQDDESKSVKRAKIFIYDLALMFSVSTQNNHPHFLVHDNILEVDQDSTERALNLLEKLDKEQADEFQYILTLNADEVESEEARENVALDLSGHSIIKLTKERQFLRTRYQEKKN